MRLSAGIATMPNTGYPPLEQLSSAARYMHVVHIKEACDIAQIDLSIRNHRGENALEHCAGNRT